MKRLNQSLKKDEILIKLIKKNLKKFSCSTFKNKVIVKKSDYIKMLRNRFISCLINVSKKEIIKGIREIDNNYRNFIRFEDILECIMYKN